MADAVPTPAAQQPKVQSTIVVEKPLSELEALKQAGWWSPVDTLIVGSICAAWLTGFYWVLFGHPEFIHFVALLLITVILLQSWLIVLILRCSRFVLRAHADIAMLPDASARIAVAYLSGGPKR